MSDEDDVMFLAAQGSAARIDICLAPEPRITTRITANMSHGPKQSLSSSIQKQTGERERMVPDSLPQTDT